MIGAPAPYSGKGEECPAPSGKAMLPQRLLVSTLLNNCSRESIRSAYNAHRKRRTLGGQVGKDVRIVCLANSRKAGDRCIAGIDVDSAEWVRPISRRMSEAVSVTERQYANRVEPRVLDVISMRLTEKRSDGFQHENWLLDSTVQWEKVGRVDWEDLCLLEQQPEDLWINGYSSWGGLNNRIPVDRQEEISDSLALIRVDRVRISEDNYAHFRYMGSRYAIKLTDPVYEERMRVNGNASQRLGESFITVSLGKEWIGYFYKLAAAIIERTEIESG
ncbi:hypothetical protein [Streptomyces sp. NPDC057794]|uniref:dual OB domain-containing protein n=1 Tax=Streptomyces sp. NPDC057794 TaxID=3346251 RepID=UPI0036BBBDD3